MRVLHLGSGFRPWRRGGLVAYVEDLMHEQVRRGHSVSYFFSGRHYPFLRRPRLKRWQLGEIAMLEVLNSPLYDHGRQPRRELDEPHTEAMLREVLAELRPDVVHVQEFAGLPTSVVDVVHANGAPVVATLQDYFPLCSTFKLLDADNRVCLRREVGADCMATTASDPRDPAILFYSSVRFLILRRQFVRRFGGGWVEPIVDEVAARLGGRAARRAGVEAPTPAVFQRRRDVNVERLSRVDRLIAMSRRVAEIYELLGVDGSRLSTMELPLWHIQWLRPRRASGRTPVTFATLGGGESIAKGAYVLRDAARLLSEEARAGRFRLLVCGHIDDSLRPEFEGLPGIELRGPYGGHELDDLLEGVDVGIMPSIWEEAYGFAGIEFLAKGVPVIANAIGGMVEYTQEGETGWLNHSRSGGELAEIMRRLIEHPERVVELNQKLRANHDSIVVPLSRHGAELDRAYEEVISAFGANGGAQR